MQKHLFLIGPAGAGKTALLRELLGDRLAMAGGLVTRPVRSASGFLLGCELAPAAALAGVEGLEAQRFLFFTETGSKTDNEVYRSYGVRLLQEAVWYPYALLDELGGFELIIPQFRAALEALLGQELPIIGAVKTPQEAELFRQYLGLGERFTAQAERLHLELAQDENTLLLDVEALGQDAAREAVQRWIDSFLR